jgi:hypothetical protein
MDKPRPKAPNVMEMIPTHRAKFEKKDGVIILLAPKFKNIFFVKHIMPRMKQPNYKIQLDAFGTSVWNLIDGEKSVFEIAKELKTEYGESVEPVYERLGLFVNMLAQRHFITLSLAGMRKA